jgi:nucleoside-specific outer membrane channel protein Tsx
MRRTLIGFAVGVALALPAGAVANDWQSDDEKRFTPTHWCKEVTRTTAKCRVDVPNPRHDYEKYQMKLFIDGAWEFTLVYHPFSPGECVTCGKGRVTVERAR